MKTDKRKNLGSLNWDGVSLKMPKLLPHKTAITALILDIEAQVDVTVAVLTSITKENPLTLVRDFRIFDNGKEIITAEPRFLRQLTERRGLNPLSGVALSSTAVQSIAVRQQVVLPFSDRWSARPTDTYLAPTGAPDQYFAEVEWCGTTAAALKAAFGVDGGAGSVLTITAAKVTITACHDPQLLKVAPPMFVPRLTRTTTPCPANSSEFDVKISSTRVVRLAGIHTLDNDVTTEGIVTKLTLQDESETHRENIAAQSWHEYEQYLFGGVSDDAGVAGAYFFEDFADNGMIGTALSPIQGNNMRWTFTVVGGANRNVRQYLWEYERVPGVTRNDLPAGL